MPENATLHLPAEDLGAASAESLDHPAGSVGAGQTRCMIRSSDLTTLVKPRPGPIAAPQAAHAQQALPLGEQLAALRGASHHGKPADPWIGRTLKDYVIEGFIGAGGMGRVYRARHRWLEMNVAIKFLKEDMHGDEVSVARFHREALAVARLNHPNIVRATDGGAIGNSFFLVMEFVPGVSIATLLNQHELTVPQICEIVCQAAAALQHAHENSMVHRDVKPSNLMLSNTGQVKLLDLGLARFAQGQAHATTLTETGIAMGSLDFMAPEQAGDSRHVDIRADIYSLGCTLYMLLTGVPPFHGPAFGTPLSKLVGHSDSEPPAVHLRRKQVPKPVLNCLKKMMAKNREERYRTPAEVIAALQPFAGNTNLVELVNTNPADAVAKRMTSPALAEPEPDWVDFVFDSLWAVVRTLLCAVGILERCTLPPSPLSISRPKTVYAVSPKGFANVIALGLIAFGLIAFGLIALFLYLSGFWIYFH